MFDILFKNATVVTMENENDILKNICVGICEKKIVYIGREKDDLRAKRIIDAANKVIMPGLYNCHAHTPMSLLRGYASDLKLQEWLYNFVFPAEDRIKKIPGAVQIGALLSIADMIGSGTIAVTDMYYQIPSIAEAIMKSGMKACITNAVLVNQEEPYNFYEDKCCFEILEVLDRIKTQNDNRLKVDAGIHAEYTSKPKIWMDVVEFAKEKGLNMQLHLSETLYEHETCKEKYHMTPTEILNKYQVFDVKTTAAHGVWLEENDMDILRDNLVTVVHSPISNLKLASGIAPVKEMLEKGINIALGTDGVSSNNSNDLFEEIKMAGLLQKYRCNDTTIISAYDALRFATVNGAISQGRENESGKIKVGFDADLIMLDFDNTRQVANYNCITNLAYSVTGRDVVLTMCQGKILYENGEYLTIDIEELLYEARKIISQLE